MDQKTAETAPPPAPDLATEIRALRRSVDTLNGHAWIRVENSLPRLLWRQLLKGLFLGLGTVMGASVLVSVVVYFLTRIDFIPIMGEWGKEIADVIEAEVNARRPQNGVGQANGDGSIAPTPGPAAPPEPAPAPQE